MCIDAPGDQHELRELDDRLSTTYLVGKNGDGDDDPFQKDCRPSRRMQNKRPSCQHSAEPLHRGSAGVDVSQDMVAHGVDSGQGAGDGRAIRRARNDTGDRDRVVCAIALTVRCRGISSGPRRRRHRVQVPYRRIGQSARRSSGRHVRWTRSQRSPRPRERLRTGRLLDRTASMRRSRIR